MPLAIDNETGMFRLKIESFLGGLNTRDADSEISDTELSGIRDFRLDRKGALSIRPGFNTIFASEAGTDAIMTQAGYYQAGSTAEHIFTSLTDIYVRVAGSTSTATIKTGLTGSGLVFGISQFFDKLFMGNGTDNIQVYNGTDVDDFGYEIPGSGVSAAEGAAGVLENKEYQYHVTYYYADGESNSNATPTSITPSASKKVELTSIPTGGTRVTQRRLYRTAGDGSTFKLLTTISDNTTTVYSDNIADSGLGADMDTDNTFTAPQLCKYMIPHKARNWFAGDATLPSRLFFSKSLEPESVPSLNFIDIGANDGDIITGLIVNLGVLVIFKRYSTWILSGDVPNGADADMVLERINPTIGCVSNQTARNAANDVIFLSPSQGVFRLQRVILSDSESMDTKALSDKIEPTLLEDMNIARFPFAHAEIFNHKYHLYLAPVGQTSITRALVLELSGMNPEVEQTIAWTQYYNQHMASSTLFRHTDGEHLYLGDNTNGFCFEFGTNASDDGSAITAYATSKYFDIGSFINYKVGRDLFLHGRASEDYEFTQRVFLNLVEAGTATESQITQAFTGGGVVGAESVMYDEALYDTVLYDSDGSFTNVVIDIMRSMDIDYDYNKIKFKIESVSANQEFLFYGWELQGFLGDWRPQG